MTISAVRDYTAMADAVRKTLALHSTRDERMTAVVDAIWRGAGQAGVSWVGFYLADESQPEDRRLILGPRRDRPACSPIGLHGVCGAAYRTREIQIIHDVAELGHAYVACDPRDRSELVIPLLEPDMNGPCWGVLDLDSFEVGAFTENDASGLTLVLRAAGFACAVE